MAASYVLSLVLVGLFSAAIANHDPDTTTTTTNSSTTPASPPAGEILDYLTEHEKAKICNVSMHGSSNMTTTPAPGNQTMNNASLCSTAGQEDDLCRAYAHAVHGFNATCVAPNVCSFSVNKTEPITTTPASPGNSTTTMGTSTTTMGPNTTVDPTQPTTPKPHHIPVSRNTVYISLAPIPQGLTVIKQCENCDTAIVFPSKSGSATHSTTMATTTQKS